MKLASNAEHFEPGTANTNGTERPAVVAELKTDPCRRRDATLPAEQTGANEADTGWDTEEPFTLADLAARTSFPPPADPDKTPVVNIWDRIDQHEAATLKVPLEALDLMAAGSKTVARIPTPRASGFFDVPSAFESNTLAAPARITTLATAATTTSAPVQSAPLRAGTPVSIPAPIEETTMSWPPKPIAWAPFQVMEREPTFGDKLGNLFSSIRRNIAEKFTKAPLQNTSQAERPSLWAPFKEGANSLATSFRSAISSIFPPANKSPKHSTRMKYYAPVALAAGTLITGIALQDNTSPQSSQATRTAISTTARRATETRVTSGTAREVQTRATVNSARSASHEARVASPRNPHISRFSQIFSPTPPKAVTVALQAHLHQDTFSKRHPGHSFASSTAAEMAQALYQAAPKLHAPLDAVQSSNQLRFAIDGQGNTVLKEIYNAHGRGQLAEAIILPKQAR